jgi:hypothetical protein
VGKLLSGFCSTNHFACDQFVSQEVFPCSRNEGSENKKDQSGRQEGSADSTVKVGWQKSSPDQKATSSGT